MFCSGKKEKRIRGLKYSKFDKIEGSGFPFPAPRIVEGMRLGEGLIFQPGGEKRAKRRGKSAALVAKRRVKRVSIVFRYYFILSPPSLEITMGRFERRVGFIFFKTLQFFVYPIWTFHLISSNLVNKLVKLIIIRNRLTDLLCKFK